MVNIKTDIVDRTSLGIEEIVALYNFLLSFVSNLRTMLHAAYIRLYLEFNLLYFYLNQAIK